MTIEEVEETVPNQGNAASTSPYDGGMAGMRGEYQSVFSPENLSRETCQNHGSNLGQRLKEVESGFPQLINLLQIQLN